MGGVSILEYIYIYMYDKQKNILLCVYNSFTFTFLFALAYRSIHKKINSITVKVRRKKSVKKMTIIIIITI